MNKYIESIKQRVKNLPMSPGVYIMRDENGTIIYIGKAKHLKNRVSQYFLNTVKQQKVQLMADSVKTFDYIICNSELEALNLEANLIKKHQPFYNILLKDGKANPFFRIDLSNFQQLRQVHTETQLLVALWTNLDSTAKQSLQALLLLHWLGPPHKSC